MADETSSGLGAADERHLRVSDRDRDDTIDLLAVAATDGRLTLVEYGERADKALVAVTRSDLVVLTQDLVSAPGSSAKASVVDSPVAAVERVVAIFGSEHRLGRWSVPGRLKASAVSGSASSSCRTPACTPA